MTDPQKVRERIAHFANASYDHDEWWPGSYTYEQFADDVNHLLNVEEKARAYIKILNLERGGSGDDALDALDAALNGDTDA